MSIKRNMPEYQAWKAARFRCDNPKAPSFKNYGGRGIGFSPLWHDFQRFLDDVGPRPGPGYSIDRIDNDGNYEPGNVKWSTAKEQANNRRSRWRNHVTVHGRYGTYTNHRCRCEACKGAARRQAQRWKANPPTPRSAGPRIDRNSVRLQTATSDRPGQTPPASAHRA